MALLNFAIFVILLAGVVYAYGTSNPQVFGHSAGEIEIEGQTLNQYIDNRINTEITNLNIDSPGMYVIEGLSWNVKYGSSCWRYYNAGTQCWEVELNPSLIEKDTWDGMTIGVVYNFLDNSKNYIGKQATLNKNNYVALRTANSGATNIQLGKVALNGNLILQSYRMDDITRDYDDFIFFETKLSQHSYHQRIFKLLFLKFSIIK